jgi:hypothetical protein
MHPPGAGHPAQRDFLNLSDPVNFVTVNFLASARGPMPMTVEATGSTRADAALLNYSRLNVVTGANGSKGVVLAPAKGGDVQRVYNSAAETLRVYPTAGGRINREAIDAPVNIGGGCMGAFECIDGVNWCVLS